MYWLAFARPGRYTIGPAVIPTGRGERRSKTAVVVVRDAVEAPRLRVFASVEPARAYVGQTVEATFEIAYPSRLERLSGFRIPFLAGTDGLDIIDPQDLYGRWREAMLRTGEGLPGYRPIKVGGAGEVAIVAISSREIDGVPHTVWSTTRVLVPKQARRFDLGRAAAVAEVVTGHRRRFLGRKRSVGKAVADVSEPLVLDVVEPPLEARPDEFRGAVGRYELAAEVSPREVALGEGPVELALVVKGEGDRGCSFFSRCLLRSAGWRGFSPRGEAGCGMALVDTQRARRARPAPHWTTSAGRARWWTSLTSPRNRRACSGTASPSAWTFLRRRSRRTGSNSSSATRAFTGRPPPRPRASWPTREAPGSARVRGGGTPGSTACAAVSTRSIKTVRRFAPPSLPGKRD